MFHGRCAKNQWQPKPYPSTDNSLDFEFQINNEPGREYMLREQLEKLADDFDFILIDCPPSLGTLSINSLVAANSFIVPMQAENFAFIGLDRIMLITEKVKKRMNPSLELDGILFVKLAPRTKFSQAVISNLTNNQNFQGKLFNTYIRQDIALMESGAFKQTIFEYAPRSRGSHDYMDLAKEILKRYGKNRRTISDIQKALLTNTQYINESDSVNKPVERVVEQKPQPKDQANIDPVVLKQFKILAPYLGESVDDLINKALNHFLRLKSLQLDQAIKKITEEE